MHRSPAVLILCAISAWSVWSCAVSEGYRVDAGADTDTDSDSDTTSDDEDAIIPDCSDCENIGTDLTKMACAVDLCYGDEVVMGNKYSSPTVDINEVDETYEAVSRFGDPFNDLAPILNESYALMATGTAPAGQDHNVEIEPSQSSTDPVTGENEAFDVVEWKLTLKAPSDAGGFKVHYVFFSEEYDEFVGSDFNDKFYIILEAASTNNGAPTVINFAKCREAGGYSDVTCSEEMAQTGVCVLGDDLCYIAVNTAYSECCWYNSCLDWNEADRTNISGTGFSCAPDQDSEWSSGGPDPDKGYKYGSSTGWLKTEWPIEKGEEFSITFHLHDTTDAKLDSEVIIDKFLFVEEAIPGTAPVK